MRDKLNKTMTLQSKINPLAKKVFRNVKAQELFNIYSKRVGVNEYGVNRHGRIYFHFMNGITEIYTRDEFIKMSNENDN